MPRVADLIKDRKDFFSLPPEATVYEAARYMREKEVRATTVCNARGEPIGVVSQSDISDQVAAENRSPAEVKVEEIMSRDLITVNPDITLEGCLLLLEQNRIYHLLVVGKDKQFYGMISAQDLLKTIAADEKARADMLQAWAFPPR